MLNLIFTDSGGNVIVADSAVVGAKDLGASGRYREETEHEFGVLIHTACGDGNKFNSLGCV